MRYRKFAKRLNGDEMEGMAVGLKCRIAGMDCEVLFWLEFQYLLLAGSGSCMQM
jgi:hypothetical protein